MNRLYGQGAKATQVEPGNRCHLVLIYEDTATRDRLMRLGDRLIGELWGDVDFEGSWWRLSFLSDPVLANVAAGAAARADIIAFSINPNGAWDGVLQKWSALWADKRAGQEGAMLVLMGTERETRTLSALPGNPFRKIAQRAKMDYLVPVEVRSPGPNVLDLFLKQANHAPLAQEMAVNPGASIAHWGINE